MDGTKTISSLQCQHLKGTGSSPSPPCPPALFRCPRSTTLVGSSSALEIDTASETGKPLEFKVKMCFFLFFFSSQLPVPRRLLPCWASKSIETLSEIIREHSQLCNFIITKGTTPSIKSSIQVLRQSFLNFLQPAYNLKSPVQTVSAADCNHSYPVVLSAQGIIYFIPNNALSRLRGCFVSLPRQNSLIISSKACQSV